MPGSISKLAVFALSLLLAPARAADYYAHWGFTDPTCQDFNTIVSTEALRLDICTHGPDDNYVYTCDSLNGGYTVTRTTYSDTSCANSTGSTVVYENTDKNACMTDADGLSYRVLCNPIYNFAMTNALYAMIYEDDNPEDACNIMVQNSAPTATTVYGRDLKTCFNNDDGTSMRVGCATDYLEQTTYSAADCTGYTITMSTTKVASDECLPTTLFPYLGANPDSWMYFRCTPYETKSHHNNDDDDEVPGWGVALIVLLVIAVVIGLFFIARIVMNKGGDDRHVPLNDGGKR